MLCSPLRTAAFLLGLASLAYGEPPIALEYVWGRLADPAGEVNATVRNGIVSGESASFSRDGKYIVTCSKADGRTTLYQNSDLTSKTAHLRLFDQSGNLLWDKPRSRGPIDPTTGRPADQPADGRDEMEVALFSRCDNYIAAGADDTDIEMWQYRDLTTGEVLADPILVRTFSTHTGVDTKGGVDSLFYSHSGDLLFAGSEPNGTIHVMRVQGDPSTWERMHVATHGSESRHGINSVALTEDDKYLATAGTNQKGGLWRLDTTRDAKNLITSVNLIRLATMNEAASTLREARFSPNTGPITTPRQELVAITAEHDWATRIYSLQALLDHTTSTTSPAPFLTLRNFYNPAAPNQRFGSPPEPLAFTPDGRFMLNTGKSRYSGSGPLPTNPAYFRFYETAELRPGRPEPDPVHVIEDQIRNPEFLDFNANGSQLTTSHHDGSVRLWNVVTSNHATIASEGFNESTSTHSRWTLSGQTIGTARPGLGTVGDVPSGRFDGKRGSRYIISRKLDPNTSLPAEHSLTHNDSWNPVGFRKLQVQFAVAAAIGEFEDNDALIIEADTTADGIFETELAKFTADLNTKNLQHVASGAALNRQFRDFLVDLPDGVSQPIRFRIRVNTTSANEEIAFDSLRLLGEPIPPDLDSGADSTSDLDESIARTELTISSSRIGVFSDPTLEGQSPAILQSVKGRNYTLQRSINFTNDWTDITTSPTLPSLQSVNLLNPDPDSSSTGRSFTVPQPRPLAAESPGKN